MFKNQKVSALYCRLSNEDIDRGDNHSVSIDTQKKKLISFALSNNMLYQIYIDDGISGTTFNRPALNQMLDDISKEKINCVIVKDLSRLGRNYLECGNLLENVFPKYKTRFIAIDDNIDRDPLNPTYETNLMIPMFNLMNEFYPADISKKTRSALRTKAMQGEYLGAYAPYGYKKSPTDKHKLIVDEEQAQWVRYIFNEIAEGTSLSQLVRDLHFKKVRTHTDYMKNTYTFNWNTATISKMIKNEVYIGNLIYNKTSTLSYKNQTAIKNNQERWIINNNSHQSIIEQELFNNANFIINLRKRTAVGYQKQPFLSKLFCSECNNYLNFTREPRLSNADEGFYTCRTNRRFGKSACSRHYIRYSILETAVMNNLRYLKSLAIDNRQNLYNMLLTKQTAAHQILRKPLEESINNYNLQIQNIEETFVKLYKDYAINQISEEEFTLLKSNLDNEKSSILHNIEEDKNILNELKEQTKHIDSFIHLLSECNLDNISLTLIHKLIDKIYVENSTIEYNKNVQYIQIYYKYIGFIEKIDINSY